MENKQILRRKNILSGNLWTTVIAIIAPLALYQLFNSFYTLIDAAICAQISTSAQTKVVAINQIKGCIAAFGSGLAGGGAVIVSRYFGAGKVKEAKENASNMLFIALVLSALLCVVFIPLAYPILLLCAVPDASSSEVIIYFSLQLGELVFVSVNNCFIGLEKAKGNSKIIMVLNVLVLTVKIGLTCAFVFLLNLRNIIFVELATIIAQALLTVVALILMFSKKNILKIELKMMKPKKEFVGPILRLSIPIFLGKFVINLGKVVVNSMCGHFWNDYTSDVVIGSLIVGTLGVSNNLSGLITSPTNSFEEGESTIVSQNLGNRNMKRTIKTFIVTLVYVCVISFTGYIMLRFVLLDQVVNLFSSPDANAEIYKDMVKKIFVWDSLSIPTLGITAAVLGLLYGYGQTKLSTILNLFRIGSRIVILLIFHVAAPDMVPTLCVGLSMGISNTVILLASIMFLIIFLIKIKRDGYRGMHLSDPEPEVSELVFD
ncbi:MAG: hypothetical protein K6G38_04360 [Gammaproteobacteria bacterium]|nr:hypothetical protein [Gammaproteobacteria bacterium]